MATRYRESRHPHTRAHALAYDGPLTASTCYPPSLTFLDWQRQPGRISNRHVTARGGRSRVGACESRRIERGHSATSGTRCLVASTSKQWNRDAT